MNILFITLLDMRSMWDHTIYSDLMLEFVRRGNKVFIVSPSEKKNGRKTELIHKEGSLWQILKPRIGNIKKNSIIEKGISTLLLEGQINRAIKKYLNGIRFDLILYSTPPITLTGVIGRLKKRDNAVTYLLLKDIFPQNAVDLGMLKKTGVKGLLYKYFKKKEKTLYSLSDYIGCMSPANVDYFLTHNPKIAPEKVEVCPNSIESMELTLSEDEKRAVRDKYRLPTDKKIFIYGGNLGKPQSVPFIIDCVKASAEIDECFFLIIGDGTEYRKLENFVRTETPVNMMLMKSIPKTEYDKLTAACDVGLIFLDYAFTIPNFPSRLLSYMQAQLPVLACTDEATDIGKVIEENGMGRFCPSNDAAKYAETVKAMLKTDLSKAGRRSVEYLNAHYTVSDSCKLILNHMQKPQRTLW